MSTQNKMGNPEDNLPDFLANGFIPSPPLIMEQIREATPDLDKIASVIKSDMGLSASVLKTINSPFYGMRNKVSSIEQAVTLLGLDSVMSIVNAQLLLNLLKSASYPKALESFWPVSIRIAETATMLAHKISPALASEMYMLGLFHRAGIPIMAGRFSNYLNVLKRAYQQHDQPITECENDQYQTNHTVVGYLVARSWQLSINTRQVILLQHQIEYLFNEIHDDVSDKNTMLAILKLAQHLCGEFRAIGKMEDDFEWELIEESILSYLGLSEHDLSNLKTHIEGVRKVQPA